MFCSNCGQRLADDAKHCPNCGMAVEQENVAEPRPSETNAAGVSAPAAPPVRPYAGYTAAGGTAPEAPKAPNPSPAYTQTYGSASAGLPPKAAPSEADGKALTGFILSLVGLVCCCTPIIGVICGILGLIFSIKGLKSETRHGMAIAGLIISGLGLLMALVIFASSLLLYKKSGSVEGFWEGFDWEYYFQN